jgi:GNAT superfamily N-acetyltransferase
LFGHLGCSPKVIPKPHRDGLALSMQTSADLQSPYIFVSGTPDSVVRRPITADSVDLADLWSEMQRHYRRPVSDQAAMEAATLACQPVRTTFDPRVLVATVRGALVGAIVLNVTFPAFELTRALYIRDLYVRQANRRQGVGQALVRAAGHLTYAEGFSALDWTTDAGNAAARQMYESCGARVLGRAYYRLAREDMDANPFMVSPAGSCVELLSPSS